MEDSDVDSDEEDSDVDSSGGDGDGGEKQEEDGEDDLIKALKSAREKQERDSPPDIRIKENITDISFHPEENRIVLCNIVGEVSLFTVDNKENSLVKKVKLHKGPIRAVEFDNDGKNIISGGKDRSLKVIDSESWKVTWKEAESHTSPLYSLLPWEQGCFSGDEDGTVKLWDFRSQKCVMQSKRFEEFVSSFQATEGENTVLAASGEGTIQSWDLRMKRPDIQSEVYNCELNCMATVRNGSKLVVGGGNGTMYLFNRNQYGYHSDQYPGHPDAVNSMIGVTDNVLITACEDGNIRAVHLYPHRFIGQVGHHEGEMPVEKLDVNSTGEIVASVGHDCRVKFWNISFLEKIEYDKKKKPALQARVAKKSRTGQTVAREQEYQLPSSGRQNKAEFFKGFSAS